MPLDMILIDFPPGSSNKGATKAPGNPCCNIFHSYSRKSFFQFEFMDRKRKRHYYFLWKICSSCMTPIDDQYTSLVTSSHTLWPLHQVDGRHTKIGLILEKFAVQFWILAFFPVQDQQFLKRFFPFFLCVCLENFSLNCSH